MKKRQMSIFKKRLITGGLILVIVGCWVFIGVSVTIKIKGFSKAKAMSLSDTTSQVTTQSSQLNPAYQTTPIEGEGPQCGTLGTNTDDLANGKNLERLPVTSIKDVLKSLYPDQDQTYRIDDYYNNIIMGTARSDNNLLKLNANHLIDMLESQSKTKTLLCAEGSFAKDFFSLKWLNGDVFIDTRMINIGDKVNLPNRLAWTWGCCKAGFPCIQCGLDKEPIACGGATLMDGNGPLAKPLVYKHGDTLSKENQQRLCPGGRVRDENNYYPDSWTCVSDNDWQVITCGINKDATCCGIKIGECAPGCVKTLVSMTNAQWGCSRDLNNVDIAHAGDQRISKCPRQ